MVQTTLQAFFRSTITGVVVQGLEALLYLLLTRVIWSSHIDLSGSGPHKLIALSLIVASAASPTLVVKTANCLYIWGEPERAPH